MDPIKLRHRITNALEQAIASGDRQHYNQVRDKVDQISHRFQNHAKKVAGQANDKGDAGPQAVDTKPLAVPTPVAPSSDVASTEVDATREKVEGRRTLAKA